jgi:hypothetical protein
MRVRNTARSAASYFFFLALGFALVPPCCQLSACKKELYLGVLVVLAPGVSS